MGRRVLSVLAVILVMALPASADTVTVFAAASLKNALDRIAADWQAETGKKTRLTYAGSAAIARQVDQGAPADLVILASEDWMTWLKARGRIEKDSIRAVVGNRLVLIAHGDRPDPVSLGHTSDLAARLGDGRLAMALVDAVPAGIYGRAALTHLGLWSELGPRVAQADNVRAALALVATGEAPFGIVYASDALAEPRVTVVARFPEQSHPPIRYPAAVIRDADRPDVREFLERLTTPQARTVFEAEGFLRIE